MRIGERDIRNGNAYIIAEAGVNHNGSRDMAHRLIDAAADSGADAVKFQTWVTDLICAPGALRAEYQRNNESMGEDQYSLLKQLELPFEWHPELRDHAHRRSIDFLSTPDDLVSAKYLVELGVPALKVGSAELDNISHLRAISAFGLPVILSSGMGSLEDVERAVTVVGESSTPVAVLHCVSAYPAPRNEMNLRAIGTMARALDIPVGLSDHSEGEIAATTAVGIGMAILEKHITLDRELPGPDQRASSDPREFAAMVNSVRVAEQMLGTGVKAITNSEIETRRAVRRVLVYARRLPVGARLAQEDLAALRTGAPGLDASAEMSLIGLTLTRSVERFQPVREEDFGN
jgi:sialic acid synthase SpsE